MNPRTIALKPPANKKRKKRGRQHPVKANSFLILADGIYARRNEHKTTLEVVVEELRKEGERVQKILR